MIEYNDLTINALQKIYPQGWAWNGGDVNPTSGPKVNDVVITAKIAELEALEPLRLLREQRNQIISATDWQASSDLTMTAEQTAYRQQLRDLPENSTPSLDDDGNLTGVTWPEVPE